MNDARYWEIDLESGRQVCLWNVLAMTLHNEGLGSYDLVTSIECEGSDGIYVAKVHHVGPKLATETAIADIEWAGEIPSVSFRAMERAS